MSAHAEGFGYGGKRDLAEEGGKRDLARSVVLCDKLCETGKINDEMGGAGVGGSYTVKHECVLDVGHARSDVLLAKIESSGHDVCLDLGDDRAFQSQ